MILTRAFDNFSRIPRLMALATVLSVAVMATGPAAHAALINYGDFPVPSAGIVFQQVTESSGTDPVPLYGPPTPFVVGLDFNPTSFVSSATGGAADVTDGQLNFGVNGQGPGGLTPINSITVGEAGDFTLLGAGTPATAVFAGAIIRVTVTQVNGLPVVPFNLAPSNASVGFNLVANPGIVQPWSLSTTIDVASQMPIGQTATRVSVTVDNSLVSTSQPGTVAFIAKKDFLITLIPGPHTNLPEPGTFALMAVAGLFGLARRGSRS
jgi:hypothetical protein